MATHFLDTGYELAPWLGVIWEEQGKGKRESITLISWRALLMAASCCTCLMRPALGSDEALRVLFRESMVAVASRREDV